jgi:phosphate/sulfate permease
MSRAPVVVAGLLGVVAGMRSQLPQAALAARGLEPATGPLSFLRSGLGRRAAYATAAGQVGVLLAVLMVIGCWLWSGRIMRLPEEERVFHG